MESVLRGRGSATLLALGAAFAVLRSGPAGKAGAAGLIMTAALSVTYGSRIPPLLCGGDPSLPSWTLSLCQGPTSALGTRFCFLVWDTCSESALAQAQHPLGRSKCNLDQRPFNVRTLRIPIDVQPQLLTHTLSYLATRLRSTSFIHNAKHCR